VSERFVLDASVTMCWCFTDEQNELSRHSLQALRDGEAVVPAIWTLEVANVLLIAERRKRLTRAESEQFLSLLEALPITIDICSIQAISSRILALGRDYQLSSYHAAYLAIAMQEGLPLATNDANLLRAMAMLGVNKFSP